MEGMDRARSGTAVALSRAWELALHMLFPVGCAVCERIGTVLCDECLSSIVRPVPDVCLTCGSPHPCATHPDAPPVRAASIYGGGMSRAILALKYRGMRAVGRRLGVGMAHAMERPRVDALVPVPLHLGSTRGYDQAQEIALGLGRVWEIPVADLAEWSLMVPSRTGMGRAQRLALPEDVFRVDPAARGLRVAVVDDVRTTGTTLLRLASALGGAGARVCGAYVAARTGGDDVSVIS
ncbi:MAG: ComF family protein [Synergistaceae bacterium]|nr:ComF family protein [Synergistaceae bacterium]